MQYKDRTTSACSTYAVEKAGTLSRLL